MDERLERVYARWCARSVLHLWDAPEVVRRWVDEGEEELRAEVRAVTEPIRSSNGPKTKGMFAYECAVRSAGDSTTGVSNAWAALWAATWANEACAHALHDSAEDGWGQARIEEQERQNAAWLLASILPDLLRTHGLAARLLDEVRKDPWLTREVVRALALPDLAVWCDWYKNVDVEV